MKSIKKLTLSGLLLAMTLLLPFLTGQIPQIGSMLSPMHIPVLLCGFICGWQYGFTIGLIAPVLRFMIFGMPPLFPVGIAMTFELAAYGLCAGIFYKILPKRNLYVFVNLILSMILGRMVWGISMYVMALFTAIEFNINIFLAGAFFNAIPGIILHLVIIPPIVIALRKTNLVLDIA